MAIASVDSTLSLLAASKSLSTLSGNLCAAEWTSTAGFISRTNAAADSASVRSTRTRSGPVRENAVPTTRSHAEDDFR